ERFGFFDESFVSAGDYEFWLRISGEVNFIAVPEVLGLFLKSPASISHANAAINAQETELARVRHWPPEWGPMPKDQRSLLDRFTRRRTYREWWSRVQARWLGTDAAKGSSR